MVKESNDKMDKIVSLAKRRGFIFPGSDIYGGLANSWDYGPLGVELKNNLRDWWWQRFVHQRDDMVGLDSAILMNTKVWESSGHVSNFNDAMVDCLKCKARHRADHLIEDSFPKMKVEGLLPEDLTKLIQENQIKCPNCGTKGKYTAARKFNLLFQTSIGTLEGNKGSVYLRGEIAQAMFINFKNVLDTTRFRLPFGIASVGKAFRNEITPGNFIFRTLEFDLMEFEYFIHPNPPKPPLRKGGAEGHPPLAKGRTEEGSWKEWFDYWLNEQKAWLAELGFDKKNIKVRQHTKDELSHYSRRTADIEYKTPFGWKEMFGLAYRTDFDLKQHMEQSGVDLRYTDPESGDKFIPHVIEPTFGLTRLVLMVLLEQYREEGSGKDKRVFLKLPYRLAPYKVAVFPLLANKPQLVEKAREVYDSLKKEFIAIWDARGNIGKRYYSQDEIGTPFCVTVDFDTLEKDDSVTVRDRDSMKQKRVSIKELRNYLKVKLSN